MAGANGRRLSSINKDIKITWKEKKNVFNGIALYMKSDFWYNASVVSNDKKFSN